MLHQAGRFLGTTTALDWSIGSYLRPAKVCDEWLDEHEVNLRNTNIGGNKLSIKDVLSVLHSDFVIQIFSQALLLGSWRTMVLDVQDQAQSLVTGKIKKYTEGEHNPSRLR